MELASQCNMPTPKNNTKSRHKITLRQAEYKVIKFYLKRGNLTANPVNVAALMPTVKGTGPSVVVSTTFNIWLHIWLSYFIPCY